MSNTLNNHINNSGLPRLDQGSVAPGEGVGGANRSGVRLEGPGSNAQRQALRELTREDAALEHYGDALGAPPTPLRGYTVQIATGPEPRFLSPSPQPLSPSPSPQTFPPSAPTALEDVSRDRNGSGADDGEEAKPLSGEIAIASPVLHGTRKATEAGGASSRLRAGVLAREFVQYFNSETHRDEVHSPALVAIKREYEDINREKASRGEKVHPMSFGAIALTEEDWLDLEDRIDEAIEGAPPEAAETKARETVSVFLKALAEDRLNQDQTAYLCRWMLSRTEMSQDERWSVMNSTVKASNKSKSMNVDVDFIKRLERKTEETSIARAHQFVSELMDKLSPAFELPFFPAEILNLRARHNNWECPLPSLEPQGFPPPAHFISLDVEIAAIATAYRPSTEIPRAELTAAFERTLGLQASSIIDHHPHLVALRAINDRTDLTPAEKLALAIEADGQIARGNFPRDRANAPTFPPQQIAMGKAKVLLWVEERVARMNQG
jgi:hypothetical protein